MMFDYFKDVVFNKYADFSGRARRSEYWYFFLVNFLISIGISFLGAIVGETISLILSGVYMLALLIPGIAVAVRRLHDTGKSGWMLLIGLIPLIGGIILLVFFATEGNKGSNKYGEDPKANAPSNAYV